jgi:hypothetical protein
MFYIKDIATTSQYNTTGNKIDKKKVAILISLKNKLKFLRVF